MAKKTYADKTPKELFLLYKNEDYNGLQSLLSILKREKQEIKEELKNNVNELQRISLNEPLLSDINQKISHFKAGLKDYSSLIEENFGSSLPLFHDITEKFIKYRVQTDTMMRREIQSTISSSEIIMAKYLKESNLEMSLETYIDLKAIIDKLGPISESHQELLEKYRIEIESIATPALSSAILSHDEDKLCDIFDVYQKLNKLEAFSNFYINSILIKTVKILSNISSQTDVARMLLSLKELLTDEATWLKEFRGLDTEYCFSHCLSKCVNDIVDILHKTDNPLPSFTDYKSLFNHFEDKASILKYCLELIRDIHFHAYYKNETIILIRSILKMFDDFDEAFIFVLFSSRKMNDPESNAISYDQISQDYTYFCEIYNDVKDFLKSVQNCELLYRIIGALCMFVRKTINEHSKLIERIVEEFPNTDISSFWQHHRDIFNFAMHFGQFINVVDEFDKHTYDLLNLKYEEEFCHQIFKSDDVKIVESIRQKYMCEKDRLKDTMQGLRKSLQLLPCRIIALKAEKILRCSSDYPREQNEPDNAIMQIGEMMLHLPIQLDSIIDSLQFESLMFMSANGIESQPGQADWLHALVKNHLRLVLDVIKKHSRISQIDNTNTDYMANILRSLECQDIGL